MTNIDKKLIYNRFSKHLETYNRYAFIQSEVCEYMMSKIKCYVDCCNVKRALEIGVGTGFLTDYLFEYFDNTHWIVNDIVEQTRQYIEKIADNRSVEGIEYVFGDAENIEFPKSLDLVATASTIQWFDDVTSFIRQLDINSGGVIAVSSFAQDNFYQISSCIDGGGLEYKSALWIESQLKDNGYSILYSEEIVRDVWFDTPYDVLRHIKLTGVNGIKKVQWNRKKLDDFSSTYIQKYYKEGKGVFLTYNPLIIIARRY